MGDQPKLNYGKTRIPQDPFKLRGAVVALHNEVEEIKRTLLENVLHLYIGEVLEIGEEGVEDSSEVTLNSAISTSKVSLKSKFYKVHKFDGTVYEKVFFNGSLSMEDPPVLGSLVLFLEVGNDYYIVKTLTTNRRKYPVGVRPENLDFEDIDRNLEPGQVRITEAQEGASLFLGNGNARLSTPSQTTFINLVNETGTINTASSNCINSFDDLYSLKMLDTQSECIIKKETLTKFNNASWKIDKTGQISFDNFYNKLRLHLEKLDLFRAITPSASLTMTDTGKLELKSGLTIDAVTQYPIAGSELSSITMDNVAIEITNANFTISLDTENMSMKSQLAEVKQDNFGTVDVKAVNINLNGRVNMTNDKPLVYSDHPLNVQAPLITLNNGSQPVARVGDQVTGVISGTVTTGAGAGGIVTGTFLGTIVGPGNPSVLA